MTGQKLGKVYTARNGSVFVPVYLEKTHTGNVYRVVWKNSGKRERKAYADFKDAKAKAADVACTLAALGASAVSLSGAESASYRQARDIAGPFGKSIWSIVSEWADAQKRLGETSLAAAVDFYLERCALVVESPAVKKAVADYIETKRAAGRSHEHVRDLTNRLTPFGEAFCCTLAELKSEHVQEWLSALKVGPRSRRNYLTSIRALAAHAERKGWMPKGGLDLSSFEREEEPLGEVAIFTPEELQAILGACRREMLPFVLIGAFCGLRHAEIARIQWGQIHFEEDPHFPHGWVEVKASQAKNASKMRSKARRLVPMTETLAAALKPLAKAPEVLVCPFQNTSNEVWKIGQASGVEWKPNGLRHSYASYRLALVRDAARVADELGNSAAMVFRHYRALVTPGQAEKWFKISPE